MTEEVKKKIDPGSLAAQGVYQHTNNAICTFIISERKG